MKYLLIAFLLCLGGEISRVSVTEAATDPSGAVRVPLETRGSAKPAHERGAGRPVSGLLDPERIGKAIHAYLEEEWRTQVKDVRVAVLTPSDSIAAPAGKMELRIVPSRGGEGVGRRLFHVAVIVNGKPWKTIEAHADVTAMIDAVMLNRAFKPEEVIDLVDLKTARIQISQLAHPFITDEEDVVGKSAARPVPADVPLRQAFLKAPVVMKKGDRVMIEAKRGGLSIQTYGVTKSSGYVGQTIMVMNPDSGRELRAKVVGTGLVEVEF